MTDPHWDRFTGLAAARRAVEAGVPESARTAAIVAPGKGEPVVRRALVEHGLIIVGDGSSADVVAIGTLSPGPMLDAAARFGDDPRLLVPWIVSDAFSPSRAAAA